MNDFINLYSYSYKGRQLCLARKRNLIDEDTFNKENTEAKKTIAEHYTDINNKLENTEEILNEYCVFCKLRLFGNIYECNKCTSKCHMVCCHKGQEINCFKCIIIDNPVNTEHKDLINIYLTMILNAHFMDISNGNFIIMAGNYKTFTITCEYQLNYILEKYIQKCKSNDYINIFDYLTDIENCKEILNKLFDIEQEHITKIHIIRNSKGQLILLINDQVEYDFNLFDFCLIKNLESQYEFKAIYDIINKTSPLHVVDKTDETDLIKTRYYPKLKQEQINEIVKEGESAGSPTPKTFYARIHLSEKPFSLNDFENKNQLPVNKWFNKTMSDTALPGGIAVNYKSSNNSGGMTKGKPNGFWYSCGDSWKHFASTNDNVYLPKAYHWDPNKYLYHIKLNPDKILFIRNLDEFKTFTTQYSVDKNDNHQFDFPLINWFDVAKDYSGIEICPYLSELKPSNIIGFKFSVYNTPDQDAWYYYWDVASGCVWNKEGIKSITLIPTNSKIPTQNEMDNFFKQEADVAKADVVNVDVAKADCPSCEAFLSNVKVVAPKKVTPKKVETKKKCSICGKSLIRSKFSKRQWLMNGTRRCITCIEAANNLKAKAKAAKNQKAANNQKAKAKAAKAAKNQKAANNQKAKAKAAAKPKAHPQPEPEPFGYIAGECRQLTPEQMKDLNNSEQFETEEECKAAVKAAAAKKAAAKVAEPSDQNNRFKSSGRRRLQFPKKTKDEKRTEIIKRIRKQYDLLKKYLTPLNSDKYNSTELKGIYNEIIVLLGEFNPDQLKNEIKYSTGKGTKEDILGLTEETKGLLKKIEIPRIIHNAKSIILMETINAVMKIVAPRLLGEDHVIFEYTEAEKERKTRAKQNQEEQLEKKKGMH